MISFRPCLRSVPRSFWGGDGDRKADRGTAIEYSDHAGGAHSDLQCSCTARWLQPRTTWSSWTVTPELHARHTLLPCCRRHVASLLAGDHRRRRHRWVHWPRQTLSRITKIKCLVPPPNSNVTITAFRFKEQGCWWKCRHRGCQLCVRWRALWRWPSHPYGLELWVTPQLRWIGATSSSRQFTP